MSYNLETTTLVVSYRGEDGEWLEGDRRELEAPEASTETCSITDAQDYGTAVEWAVQRIKGMNASEASLYPIGDAVPEHAWLSETYEDPYRGDSHVTETSVRLTGDWTPEERAQVFRAVAGRN